MAQAHQVITVNGEGVIFAIGESRLAVLSTLPERAAGYICLRFALRYGSSQAGA